MSRRKREMREKKVAKLERQGRLVIGTRIPLGAIPADVSKQIPAGYSQRPYYKDIEFHCRDCGAESVWRAKEQRWYFEVVKAHPRCEPNRCRSCRKARRTKNALLTKTIAEGRARSRP